MKRSIRTLSLLAIAALFAFMPYNAVARPAAAQEEQSDTLAVLTEKATNGDAVAQNTLGLWYYVGRNVEQNYRTAFEWWGKSAAQGNIDAIGNMGLCYQFGRGTAKDTTMAAKLYLNAIKKGNDAIIPQHEAIVKNTGSLFSARLLYECYKNGIGVKRNTEKQTEYMTLLAEGGDTDIQYSLALLCLNKKQTSDAVKWFKAAADADHTGAIYYYGYLTFKGLGTTQDKKTGIEFMQKAADRGFVAAHRELGLIYYNGDGVDQDYATAVAHLQKAASTNNEAAWTLGLCYLNGTGVAQDYYFATQWLAEAARSHEDEFNTLVFENKGDYYNYIEGLKYYYVTKDYATAIKWFKKVQNAEGLTMTAVCYANKNYEKRNVKKAVKTFTKAAGNGSVAACYYLSALYENGEGTDKNDAKAVEMLKKAADGGVAYAECALGNRHFDGKGVAQDLVQAVNLYLSAEAQNRLTPDSAKNLIKCYQRQVSALPDLDNAEQRIEALKKTQNNTKLLDLLKAIKN